MPNDLAYKKELLVLKGEMLRLKLRHEMAMSRSSAGLAGIGWQIISSGSKGRVLINLFSRVIPNQRLRSVFKTIVRGTMAWKVARKVWSQH